MTARVLPVAEWPRLAATSLADVWPTLDPAWAEVLVVEEAGAIVGSLTLLAVPHAECLTVPASIAGARALWTLLQARVAAWGARSVWGSAVDTPMQRLLERHGAPVPGSHFLVRV